MTYYRFRVVGREARDISTVFNSALSRRGGEESPKKSPVLSRQRHQSRTILGNGHRRNLLAPGYTGTQDPDPIRFVNEAALPSPAGWKNGAALPQRSSPATFIVRDKPERRSEAITRLPAHKSLKVSDYFRGVPRSPLNLVVARVLARRLSSLPSFLSLLFFWLLKRSEYADESVRKRYCFVMGWERAVYRILRNNTKQCS